MAIKMVGGWMLMVVVVVVVVVIVAVAVAAAAAGFWDVLVSLVFACFHS